MRRFVLCFCLLTLFCRPAYALFGTENFALVKIAYEQLKSGIELKKLVQLARETSQFARETADFAKESMEAGRSLQHFFDDDNTSSIDALKNWAKEFPDIKEICDNAVRVRELLAEAKNPDSTKSFSVDSVKRAHAALGKMRNSFDVLARAMDQTGVSAEYDKSDAALTKDFREAVVQGDQLKKRKDKKEFNSLEAASYTAQATSHAAKSQAHAALSLQRMSRLMEINFANDAYGQNTEHGAAAAQQAATQGRHLRSWGLEMDGKSGERR